MTGLPFKQTEIVKDFAGLQKIIFGPPKIGKTTFCSHIVDLEGRKPAFIATEDGHSFLEVMACRVTSWVGFKKLVDTLYDQKESLNLEYSGLVVDIVCDLEDWCHTYILQREHAKTLKDAGDFGGGYKMFADEFKTPFSKLFSVAKCTFITHETEREIKDEITGITKKRVVPMLGNKAMKYINGKCDCIIRMHNYNGETLISMTEGGGGSLAGSRCKALAKDFVFHHDDPFKTYQEIQSTFTEGE